MMHIKHINSTEFTCGTNHNLGLVCACNKSSLNEYKCTSLRFVNWAIRLKFVWGSGA